MQNGETILQAPSVPDPAYIADVQLRGFASVATGKLKSQVQAVLSQGIAPEQGIEKVWDMVDSELVMVGRHDRNVGVEVCTRLTDAIRRAKLVVFEASAHFPDIEEPAQYAAAVQAFLMETPSDSPQA